MPNPVGRQWNHAGILPAPARQQPRIGAHLRGHLRDGSALDRQGADRARRVQVMTTAITHLIGGHWMPGRGEAIVSRNPARPDVVVAEGGGALAADVDAAVTAATEAATAWATTPIHQRGAVLDRKSTRLNSSHVEISYAVFCLKKKKEDQGQEGQGGTPDGDARGGG